jgi:fatty-acyl-CoA synthase
MSRPGPSDDEPHGAGLPGHWPPGVPRHVPAATRSLWGTLCASAERVPDRAAIVFDDRATSYAALVRDAEALAGWLQQRAGVQPGDRVLLMAQNGPRLVTAHYAVFRADAVVVPVNAMWTAAEVGAVADDSGARVAVVARALLPAVVPLVEAGRLASVLVIDEAEAPPGSPAYAAAAGATAAPADIRALLGVRATPWHEALGAGLRPAEHRAGPADLCVLPYTSGTTGRPKGCRHTHATVQASNRAAAAWRRLGPDEVFLGVAPIFHMLGMQNGMHLPLQLGATVVMLPRWDREAALALIQRHRVTCWAAPPAMLVDFFSNPAAETADLSSLHLVNGGGAAMPASLAERMRARWRLEYNEGYGLTETASFLHANPRGRGKPGSLGLPGPGVESRVVDTVTGAVLPPGEVGEIVTRGPQLMLGYWQRPDADREAFAEIEGRRWFRTGDLGLVDGEGYFFMRDRLKRMVVVSGYKVWPAEVEGLLHDHPAVHEACVVAVPDARSGEAVRALVALRPGQALSAEDLIAWCRARMAVYKAPRSVRFVDALPKSTTGKVLWRELQQREREAAAGDGADDPAIPTAPPPGASLP